VAELPKDVQQGLKAVGGPIALPAMYDHLTWYQRKQVREDYILLQKGLCWHCKADLSGPPPERITKLSLDRRMFGANLEFLKHPIHLHHNHRTGLTIGATHAYCNAVLAQYFGE